jgi:Cu-processing system permease protein
MKRIGVLVLSSLRETLRDKIILVLIGIGSTLLLGIALVAPLSLGARDKTYHDLGLAWINLSGLLVLLVLGTWLLHRERERGIWLTILTRPVGRVQYLLGRFLGLLTTLGLTLIATGIIYALIAKATGIQPVAGLGYALFYTFMELSLLAGLLLLFSTVTGFTLSVLLALAVFFAGHMASDLLRMGKMTDSGTINGISHVFYWLLPHLEIYRIRDAMVAGDLPSVLDLLRSFLYTLLYLGALFGLAFAAFFRKEIR